eukprot:4850423-Ditylum_brightwellii.AAC.1
MQRPGKQVPHHQSACTSKSPPPSLHSMIQIPQTMRGVRACCFLCKKLIKIMLMVNQAQVYDNNMDFASHVLKKGKLEHANGMGSSMARATIKVGCLIWMMR